MDNFQVWVGSVEGMTISNCYCLHEDYVLEYSSFNLGQSFIFAGIFIPKFRAFIYTA